MKIASTESCGCDAGCATPSPAPRTTSVTRALRLEYLTVGWNIVEGIAALAAAIIAKSVAILGFGLDSFVECASALVMIWRLRAERAHGLTSKQLELVEHRARRLVASSLLLLAFYVTFDALRALWTRNKPSFSAVGTGLLVLSIAIMLWLARAKRRVARQLGSEALAADASQTTACWWLSVAALIGVGLNGLFGWWWADPAAALAIAVLIVREGREAWRGVACC
jgi:divalent metal cation (Fe/Co/Zn/Cd) transporter